MLDYFDTSRFMPHGHCFLWMKDLLALHVTANAIIALAYFTIPIALLQLVRKRRDLAFNWIYIMFAIFILACGTGHVMDIITLWKPYYWADGVIRAITALASVGTAAMLWPLLPKVLALPSARELAQVNRELQSQIEERSNVERELHILHKDLEERIKARTADLAEANAALKLEIEQRNATKLIQSRLAAIIESSEDAIIGEDLTGLITSWNRGAERIFGYQAHEVIGQSIRILFPKDKTNDLPAILAAIHRGEQISHQETERVCKDGRHIFVSISISPIKDQSGEVSGVAKISRDITQKKSAEDRIRRWEYIFKHAGWAVALIKPKEDVLEEVNPAFAAMHGYELHELAGQPLSSLVASEELDRLAQINATIDEQGSLRYELTHIRKDGSKFPVLTTANLFKDGSGKAQFRAATVQDISEQKDFQQKIESAMNELVRSNTDLEQFSYVASHDLQEPLRKMSSFSQLLAQEYGGKLDGDALDYLNFIVDGANRMQKLIDDLLEFSRIGTSDSGKQNIELEKILQQVLDTLELQIADYDAKVTFDPLPAVYADASDMVRVFQNLIANALKYRSTQAPVIHVSCMKKAKDWLFCVEDNGIGIEPRHLGSIFIIFKRLHGKNKYPGTGIGLSICKKVIERHGGKIWVESAGTAGSKFFFTLPVKREGSYDKQQ